MDRESYERGQRALIIAGGFEAIPASFDEAGNCKTCGECGRCPGYHPGKRLYGSGFDTLYDAMMKDDPRPLPTGQAVSLKIRMLLREKEGN